jgi:hypothetical protein
MRAIPSFAVVAIAALAACSPPTGAHWQQVGSVESDYIRFVQIEAASAQDGSVYREAAAKLAGSGTWQIGFFLPGDVYPPNSGSRGDFFNAGGWKGYKPAAVYVRGTDGGEFTAWDCEKAGTKDAPLSALCGTGAKDQYDAVLHLATRDAWVQGCGLRAVDGKAVVTRFAGQFDPTKRDQLMQAYDKMYAESLSGPDDRADCANLRGRIEANAISARGTLVGATPKG